MRTTLLMVLGLALGAGCGEKTKEPVGPPPAEPAELEEEAAPARTRPPVSFPTDCESVLQGASKPGNHDRFSFTGTDELVGFKNGAGEVVIKPQFLMAYEFNEHGVAAAIVKGDTVYPVFIDTTGEVLAVALMFDNGPDYFVNGLARIVADGKTGFIDATGKIAIEPQFDGAGSFCAGRAPVCRGCTRGAGGEHGYIDRSGALVIPYQFEETAMFDEDGTGRAKKDGAWVTIDRDGKVITPAP